MKLHKPTPFTIICALVFAAGIALWLRQMVPGRGLFLDEANLALNLYERSFLGFFRSLDHQQYAPPLFLFISKGMAELFGYQEIVLRILPFIGGILAVVFLWKAGQGLGLKRWSLLAPAFLFINPLVLRYVSEFKPYSLDMGLAALVIYLIVRSPAPKWWWIPLGIIYPWVSMPGVFVLAGAGLFGIFVHAKWRVWVGYAFVWLISFGLYYVIILRSDAATEPLVRFHSAYFFPLQLFNIDNVVKAFWLLVKHFTHVTGFTTLAIISGMFTVFLGLRSLDRTNDLRWVPLILPFLLALVVSGLKLYSLIPRMMLFSLPGLLLLIGVGASAGSEEIRTKLGRPWSLAWVALWVVILGGTNIIRHFHQPLRTTELRRMLTDLRDSPTYFHHFSRPGTRYYQRVHPDAAFYATPALSSDHDWPGLLDSTQHFQVVYELLTDNRIRNAIIADSLLAVGKGFQVERQNYVNGTVLRGKRAATPPTKGLTEN